MRRPTVPAGVGRWLRVAAIVVALVLVVFFLVPSGGPEARTLPPPSSTSSTQPTTTTTAPDYSLIALDSVPGRTTTTVPVSTGHTTLQGSVEGPDGPVPGAVVRADRLVGDAVQRTEVQTAADGTFSLPGLPGGRFRVRAFLPGSLAMDDAEVFFIADGETRDLRLIVQAYSGLAVRASTNPVSPIVGDAVNLAVLVAERTVDDSGIAREVPRAGLAVRVSASGWTALDDLPVQFTDADGVAVFQFRCDRVSTVVATAVVGADEETFPLEPPACAPVPPTTTSTTSTTEGTSTTQAGGSSTTSRPTSGSTTSRP